MYLAYVSSGCCKNIILKKYVVKIDLVLHMLQWLYTYVASVYSNVSAV
jgi:hypothetical protein